MALSLVAAAPAAAYEIDLHFHGVYAILRLAGLSDADALLVARASYSVDTNAENSPFPEPTRGDKTRYWTWRAKQWHALPGSDETYIYRRMRELYGRALAAPDDRTARIYFGQYLHYVGDSWSHPGFHNIIGHLLAWHRPDEPVPERRTNTFFAVFWLAQETVRFEQTRFKRSLRLPSSDIDALVDALAYAAPTYNLPAAMRAPTARVEMERALRNRGFPLTLPVWHETDVPRSDPRWSPIPFTETGEVKPISEYHPSIIGETLDRAGAISARAATALDRTLTAATPAGRAAVAAALAPLGVQDPQLGGIDLTNVRINYVSDAAGGAGQRALAFGLEPDPSGRGAHAAMAVQAFAAALTLPDESWWVNLNPREPERVIDPLLGGTDVGRAMLEADLLLKTIAYEAIRPGTASGDAYWREAFTVVPAGTRMQTEWRVWIAPGDCTARVTREDLEIVRCLLDVRLNLEALTSLSPVASAAEGRLRQSELQLRETHILPVLRGTVNEDPRFAELRSIYYSRALAQAYKQRFGAGGAVGRLVDALDMQAFPAAARRAPAAIWRDVTARFENPQNELRVTSPHGDRRVIIFRSGGITLDDVSLRGVSDGEIVEVSPPGKGLLVVRATASSRSRSTPYVEAALAAYRAAAARDRVDAAARSLLPALAFLKSPEFDAVRRDLTPETRVSDRIALAEALNTGTSRELPWLGDAAAFAIWSRRNPREAARVFAGDVNGSRLFAYAFALLADPRAGDSPQSQLLATLVAKAPRTQADRVALLAAAAAVSSITVPAVTPQVVDQLRVDVLGEDAFKSSNAAVFAAIGVLTATNAEMASALLDTMNGVDGLTGASLQPALAQAQRELVEARARLADAERMGDPASGDLVIAALVARKHWVTSRATGVARARFILDRALKSPPSDIRDDAIARVLPLLASTEPARVAELAAQLRRPAHRMTVFSALATSVVDSWASDLLLSQQIVRETAGWLIRPLA